eukprot:8533533-Karenia_brevis.AAC.1
MSTESQSGDEHYRQNEIDLNQMMNIGLQRQLAGEPSAFEERNKFQGCRDNVIEGSQNHITDVPALADVTQDHRVAML